MESIKGRNPSIDVFRYICAVLVIAIHTGPLKEINPSLGYIATDVIPRIGVPFFFIVSGYFYTSKLQNGEKPFWRYLNRIFVIYIVWSIPYFLIEFLQWGHEDLKGFIINCLVTFVYYGSSYHFWFFPALIFAVCFTTLLWRLSAKKVILPLSILLYIIGVLGCAYYNKCQNIPMIGQIFAHPQFDNIRRILLMGFPFFAGGYLVLQIKDKLRKQDALLIWIASVVVWVVEIILVVKMQYQQTVVITFGLYFLEISTLIVLLHNPMLKLSAVADTSRKLANYTYYIHPIIILIIHIAGECSFLGQFAITNTAVFFMTVVVTFTTGLLICKIDKPLLNRLIE